MFKDSVEQNRVHRLGDGPEIDFDVLEPTYLLKTSGSSSQKSYLHRLSDIKKSVDSFLKVFPLVLEDRWGVCLSTNHVAGFSILARSYFGKLKDPHQFIWSVDSIEDEIKKNDLTVLSLVPTQIFDLVSKKIKAPLCIKYIFVGGAYISPSLFKGAKDLGWPLVGCYGSTETFAQMSYSKDGSSLQAFPGWEFSLGKDDEILLKGPGLYWAELEEEKRLIKRVEEKFATGDRGSVEGESFKVLGKLSGKIKVKGSYFDFNKFKEGFLAKLLNEGLDLSDCFPVALEEERNGAGIYVVTTKSFKELDKLLKEETLFRGAFRIETDVFSEIGKPNKTKLEDVLLRRVVSL
ncbi:MAG: hypothetical protein ACRBBP_07105 [Bdellovibrionales bacterium]